MGNRILFEIVKKDESILADMFVNFNELGLLNEEVVFSNAVASETRANLGPEWENKIKVIFPEYPRIREEYRRFIHGIVGSFLSFYMDKKSYSRKKILTESSGYFVYTRKN